MKQDQIDLLISEIDSLAFKTCRKMTPAESNIFFKHQEQNLPSVQMLKKEKKPIDKMSIDEKIEFFKSSSKNLKKKYKAPIRTYYKGNKRGQIKTVYEVDGILFEKLWKHLFMYATKASMYSHKSNNFQDFEVQNDVADIKYQVFFVLRFWGPQPSGQKFSMFFKLIVNNILTTSARRRGVYREEASFMDWFDNVKYDDSNWEAYQEKIANMKRYSMFIDFMYDKFLELYFKKEKKDILKARKEHAKLDDGTSFIWRSKNCARTMMTYRSTSIFSPVSRDEQESTLIDVIRDPEGKVVEDFDIDIKSLNTFLTTEKNKKRKEFLDDSKLWIAIKMILDGASLTAAAKARDMQPSQLRAAIKKVTVGLC